MAGRGFIHDKLEIKFLILYIAARVIEPIPFDVVLDLTMCDDAIDYFDFSECLADLVKTEHLTLSEEGLYAITDKGIRNSQICESSLPYSVRLQCDKNLAVCNRKLRRKSQVKASYEPRSGGGYTVRMQLDASMISTMTITRAASIPSTFFEPEPLFFFFSVFILYFLLSYLSTRTRGSTRT